LTKQICKSFTDLQFSKYGISASFKPLRMALLEAHPTSDGPNSQNPQPFNDQWNQGCLYTISEVLKGWGGGAGLL
jgi:hypothetical protein